MARSRPRTRPADAGPGDVTPAGVGVAPADGPGDDPVRASALDELPRDDEPDGEIDPRDAEIERLRAELAALKGASPAIKGGRFTLSWKDGPTVTIEVKPGERPEDALSRYGVHSTPHRIEVHEAPEDAPLGTHYPGGVKAFHAPVANAG